MFVHKSVCVTGLPVCLKVTDAERGSLSLITWMPSKSRENYVMTGPLVWQSDMCNRHWDMGKWNRWTVIICTWRNTNDDFRFRRQLAPEAAHTLGREGNTAPHNRDANECIIVQKTSKVVRWIPEFPFPVPQCQCPTCIWQLRGTILPLCKQEGILNEIIFVQLWLNLCMKVA